MVILDPLIRLVILVLETYVWVVIASAILSWLVAFQVVNTGNQFINTVGRVLYSLTEPALRPIRGFIPNLGGIDLSPIVLILLLYFLQMVLWRVLASLHGMPA